MLTLSTRATSFENTYTDPECFLKDLSQLAEEQFYLRGVENRIYCCQPKAFRPHEIIKNRQDFPIPYLEIKSKWFYHADVIRFIQDWYRVPTFEIKRNRTIYILFELLSYLMVCNYLFSKYKESNPGHVFEYEYKQLTECGSFYWADQKTFNHMVEYYFPKILTREGLDRSWRQEGYIDNIITGIDMSFPQHYSTPTALLDFTKNYLVAIYFAIESHLNIKFDHRHKLYLAEKEINHDENLSIYALKMINPDSSPIKIEEIDSSRSNIRATNQEGVLCSFSEPCSYYMKTGQFPKIENYLSNPTKYFIFKKLSLKKTAQNLEFLGCILNKKNINQSFIYLDLHAV